MLRVAPLLGRVVATFTAAAPSLRFCFVIACRPATVDKYLRLPRNWCLHIVPVRIEIIKNKIPENLIPLVQHCLTSTYFSFQDTYYEQVSGAAMGSPISPIIADIYMEHLENQILNDAPLKPTQWFRYVDDTFVVWSHGRDTLDNFLQYINSLHPNIQFTMEIENTDRSLPFLDVLITRKPDGSLGHQVYRKPTHTNRYLHASSHHHPAQKNSVISSLINRAISISEKQHLPQELEHLRTTLGQNGFSKHKINRTIDRLVKPKDNRTTHNNENYRTTFLPYVQGTTDRISRILKKHNIKTIFTSHTKIGQILTSPKDPQPRLSTPGVYKIPCSCGKVYIGETGRSVSTRVKEHERCARLGYFQSAVAEHQLTTGHTILFNKTTVLARTKGYFPRKHRETLEIKKHPNNINRDTGYNLNPICVVEAEPKESTLALNFSQSVPLRVSTTRRGGGNSVE
ncbi:uncharacterized protein LOC143363201 [Halictus rubicundus]|uniref:uncharacterized protein LOC143363201 n=1 Tax=Halictus rubicundus TaxID=77578 RepID=UPI004035E427